MAKHSLQFKIALCIPAFTAGIYAQNQSTNSLDAGPWPTPAHDNQRTNRSHLQGPSLPGTPTLLYDAGSPVNLDYIAVTSDGKLMLSACTNQVTAIHGDGSPVGTPWPYSLMQTAYPGHPETPWGGVTVSADGHIYVASHECPDVPGGVPAHFYSIEPSGTSTPNWPVGARAMYWAPAIGSDGTIYQMDEYNFINAYHPDGSLAWNVHLNGYGNAAIALDSADNLYIGTDGNSYGGHALYSLTSSGVVRPGWPQDPGGIADTTPVLDANGIMYIANLSGSLFSFNSDGSKRGGFPFQSGGAVSQFPLALSGAGIVYLKTSLGLFAINPNGTSVWSAPFAPGGDATLSPSPIVDRNGAIYVAFGSNVYSLNPDGSTRQGWPVPIPSAGYMAIGGNDILFVVSAGQKLYSIRTGFTEPLLTVTANDASRPYGMANPVLTYAMSGFVNGDTQASATTGAPTLKTTATASSAPGNYSINIDAGTLMAAGYTFSFENSTLVITQAGTKTALVSSNLSLPVYSPVTFTAKVDATTSGMPTGIVAFSDSTTQSSIGAATLVNGTATYTTSGFSAGVHFVTASYSGDTNFVSSVSNILMETVGSNASAPCVPDALSTGIDLSDSCSLPSAFPQWSKTFGNNSKLEVTCSWAYNDGRFWPAPAYMAWYSNPQGRRARIAQCLFSGGVNDGRYTAGHLADNPQQSCLASVDWENLDGGPNDGQRYATDFLGNSVIFTTNAEPYLDLVDYHYDGNQNKLSWRDEKFNYPDGTQAADDGTLSSIVVEQLKPIPDLTYSLDPFVGAETDAMFNTVWEELQSEPRHAMRFIPSCDLNADGLCDSNDAAILSSSVGTCEGQPGYISRIDVDHNGCITATDVSAIYAAFQSYRAGCTYSQGYWKAHGNRWPTSNLRIGDVDYSQAQLLAIMNQPVHGNGAVALAQQLIAAKLNVIGGGSPIAPPIGSADALILNLAPGQLPPLGNISLPAAATSNYVGMLTRYNEGLVGPPSCPH